MQPEETKITILKTNEKPTSFITYSGALNDVFFTEVFASGDIEGMLNQLYNNATNYQHRQKNLINNKKEESLLTPHGNGISVIHIDEKIIYNMNHYENADVLFFDDFQSHQAQIKSLTENNLIYMADELNNQDYSLVDFFGTNNYKHINELLENLPLRLSANGIINQYTEQMIFPHVFKVKNFNFTLKNYFIHEADQLFVELHNHGVKFTEKELSQWLN